MIFGYARVSTQDQNLDAQLDALKKKGCERIFQEKESGAKDDRPERAKLLEQLRPGDTLIIYKFDRFGRSFKDLIEKADMLRKMEVHFESICDGIVTNTPMGKVHFIMIAAMAEFFRDTLLENTNAGLKAARARGRVGGRKEKLTEKQKKDIKSAYDKGAIPVTQLAASYNVHRNTIYNIINLKLKSRVK
jgi:DNA invertase Pin-like site-specific DNA recombinase